MKRLFVILLALAAAGALAFAVVRRLAEQESGAPSAAPARPPAPVAVAPIERGSVTLLRTFSGALDARAEFVVTPKVGGNLERLAVDIGDTVRRGQVVAWIDDAEYALEVTQARADLAVAEANHAEAVSALEIAERAVARLEALRQQGVTSESAFDAAKSGEIASRAHVEVTVAQVHRAEAALETARIRLGYAQVVAAWREGDDERVVGERWVDEGSTVTANTPVLSIVELDPIVGVIYVAERDYARLSVGLPAKLATAAYPGETFAGRVERIAPVFRRSTRQVRVELAVQNTDHRLKPGMFVRATLELGADLDAVIVPYLALTERDDEAGVFVVADGGTTVRWRPVTVGIREGGRVAVEGLGLEGLVVTLGQELCDDGSPIVIPDRPDLPPRPETAPTSAESTEDAAEPEDAPADAALENGAPGSGAGAASGASSRP